MTVLQTLNTRIKLALGIVGVSAALLLPILSQHQPGLSAEFFTAETTDAIQMAGASGGGGQGGW